jgi:hypothetical protein
MGADSVVLSSNDTFYSDLGYDTTGGVMVVIGVKALANNVTYQIVMSGPTKYSIHNFYDLNNG